MSHRIYENGVYRDMTAEELAIMKAASVRARLEEAARPLTEAEVSRKLIAAQINTLDVDDNTALRMAAFYPTFEDVVGKAVKTGTRFTYGGKLWKTVQHEMTVQAHYPPGAGMESLYTEVCETHSGTEDDSIPYNGNMALVEGLYYHQDYVIYRCVRSSGTPVYHKLSELVGLYVEVTI